jgi:carboxyl-terminal processing protease
MNKSKIYLPVFLAMATAVGIFIGSNLNYQNKSALLFSSNPQEQKIKKLIDFIEYDYVDDINTDSLLDGTIKNIVSKLDPHSVYIPAIEHEDIEEKMNGKFVGIGIQFRMIKDSLTIINTIKGGPSEKVGLKAGDRILMADADTLSGKNLGSEAIIKELKGKKNSVVTLRVYRKTDGTTLDYEVARGEVPIKSVDAAYLIKDDIGYIKLHNFTATSYKEFSKELSKLISKGMNTLVLDLRGNTGGFIGVTTKIIDEFLEDNKLIVSTKNNKGAIEKILATDKGEFENGKVYVLIDEDSASASEILAGALQDHDKGIIVGRRSFGKGLVQQDMELGDGSSVRLTTARYYTPLGRSIQKPYRLNHKSEYYEDDFQKRYLRGELTSKDSIHVVDSLKFVTPKGKVVYGGGGIIPDVFVPLDTNNMVGNFYFNVMNDFVFNYVDNHRKEFENMTISSFMENFDSDNKISKAYFQKIAKSYHLKNKHNQQIKHYLKAMFARELFNDYGFYQVLNTNDKVIQKVLALEGIEN